MTTRRHFLKAGLATAALPRFAFAKSLGERRFVFMLLRGGMDGLAAVPPWADPDYADLRAGLALNRDDGAFPLDGRFWLHPAMPEAYALYKAGELAIVHASAPPHRTRSHFDAQNIVESGGVRAFERKDGWLNRAIGAAGGDGLAVAGTLPLAMRGAASVGSWAPRRRRRSLSETLTERVQGMYAADPILGPAFARALDIQAMANGAPGGARRSRAFTLALDAEVAAELLSRPAGPRVAMLEGGQWDTHAGQGARHGRMARLLGDLSAALGQLKSGLGPAWTETVVVVATEFGRTVRPNGANGSDHGHGGVTFLAGGAVAGGKVVADWPGLAPGALYDGRDLAATTDLRSVLKGAVGGHLRVSNATLTRDIFPGSVDAPPLQDLIKHG